MSDEPVYHDASEHLSPAQYKANMKRVADLIAANPDIRVIGDHTVTFDRPLIETAFSTSGLGPGEPTPPAPTPATAPDQPSDPVPR